MLMTLLLPGVSPDALREQPGFSALGLSDYQAFTAGVEPGTVADIVKRKLATIGTPAITPLDRLEQMLENNICKTDADSLQQICDVLGDVGQLGPPDGHAHAIANVLAVKRHRERPAFGHCDHRAQTYADLGIDP